MLDDRCANLRWVGTDFNLGDLLLFPALTVHRALHNLDTRRMRLSVDFRYQREGEALTEQYKRIASYPVRSMYGSVIAP